MSVVRLAAGPCVVSQECIERFRPEARTAACTQQPEIVAIHEVGSPEKLHICPLRMSRSGPLPEAGVLTGSGLH